MTSTPTMVSHPSITLGIGPAVTRDAPSFTDEHHLAVTAKLKQAKQVSSSEDATPTIATMESSSKNNNDKYNNDITDQSLTFNNNNNDQSYTFNDFITLINKCPPSRLHLRMVLKTDVHLLPFDRGPCAHSMAFHLRMVLRTDVHLLPFDRGPHMQGMTFSVKLLVSCLFSRSMILLPSLCSLI